MIRFSERGSRMQLWRETQSISVVMKCFISFKKSKADCQIDTSCENMYGYYSSQCETVKNICKKYMTKGVNIVFLYEYLTFHNKITKSPLSKSKSR